MATAKRQFGHSSWSSYLLLGGLFAVLIIVGLKLGTVLLSAQNQLTPVTASEPSGGAMVNPPFQVHDIVLKNQVVLGTVNAPKVAFENGIHDLLEFQKQWPGQLQNLITGYLPIERFHETIKRTNHDEIKTVLTVSQMSSPQIVSGLSTRLASPSAGRLEDGDPASSKPLGPGLQPAGVTAKKTS